MSETVDKTRTPPTYCTAPGVGVDLEEHSDRIYAVATLVKEALGGLAALTIAVPSERYYGREQELSEALRSTVTELNETLGAEGNMK